MKGGGEEGELSDWAGAVRETIAGSIFRRVQTVASRTARNGARVSQGAYHRHHRRAITIFGTRACQCRQG